MADLDAARHSLTRHTMSAVAWRFVAIFSKLFVQVLVMVVLARLLPVEDFGQLSLALIVVGLAAVVAEVGVVQAVIQRSELTGRHIRVAFTLSALVGLAMTVLIVGAAVPIARGLGDARVAPLLRIIAMTFALDGLATTAGALLQRRLEFRRLTGPELGGYLTYGAASILLAKLGWGAASMAWALVAQSVVRSALLMRAVPHPMAPSLARTEVGHLLGYGAGMGLSRVANYAAHNADYFVVGRWLGAGPLGLYSRAYQLMTLPVFYLTNTVTTVLFPAFARIQADRARMARVYLDSVIATGLAVYPAMALLGLAAPEIMRGLFGPVWLGAALPFRVLCVAGGLRAMTNLGDTLARSKGRVYAQAAIHAMYAVDVLVGSALGLSWGIGGVSAGVLGAVLVHYALVSGLSLRLAGLGWKPYLGAQAPGMAVAAAVALAAYPAMRALREAGLPDLVVLAGATLTSGVAAVVAVAMLPGRCLGQKLAALRSRLWGLAQLGNRSSHPDRAPGRSGIPSTLEPSP